MPSLAWLKTPHCIVPENYKLKYIPGVLFATFLTLGAAVVVVRTAVVVVVRLAFFTGEGEDFRTPAYSSGEPTGSSSDSSSNVTVEVAALFTVVLPPSLANID